MPPFSNAGKMAAMIRGVKNLIIHTYLRKKYSKDFLWRAEDINCNDANHVTKRTKQVHDHLKHKGRHLISALISYRINKKENVDKGTIWI